jgi:HAD superfamily hydrolase (TIGR01484 family)
MTPEMAVFDIDRTLVHGRGDTIHPLTAKAVARLVADRVPVTLATGRPVPSALRAARAVHAQYVAPCGGAVLMSVPDEVLLWSAAPLSAEVMSGLWASGARVHAHRPDGTWHATRDDATTAEYARLYDMPGVKLTSPYRPVMVEVVDYPGLTVVRASAHNHIYTNITPGGVDKATAVSVLLRTLGIDWSHVFAMGDGDNDRPVFRLAGCRVAVHDATPALLDHATHHVAHGPDTGAVGVAVLALVYDDADQLARVTALR